MKNFFRRIWKWFLSLFKRKDFGSLKEDTPKKEPKQAQKILNPETPQHNNRRVTKGRFVQYINVGEGRKRAIYHGAK